jgi:transposase
MTDSTHYVGIDVSKAQLDWASRPSGERHRVPNTEAGVSGLVEQWRVAPPTAIVVEATGRLEVPLVSALAAAGLPVSVVNPRQVRDFAKATGRWAKTDAMTRPCWRSLPKRCARRRGRSSMRRPKSCARG